MYKGGIPCMYIVTFSAHQQRNMVRTPHFSGAVEATGWREAYVVAKFELAKCLMEKVDQGQRLYNCGNGLILEKY